MTEPDSDPENDLSSLNEVDDDEYDGSTALPRPAHEIIAQYRAVGTSISETGRQAKMDRRQVSYLLKGETPQARELQTRIQFLKDNAPICSAQLFTEILRGARAEITSGNGKVGLSILMRLYQDRRKVEAEEQAALNAAPKKPAPIQISGGKGSKALPPPEEEDTTDADADLEALEALTAVLTTEEPKE